MCLSRTAAEWSGVVTSKRAALVRGAGAGGHVVHRAGSAAITRNVADLADPPSAAAAKAEARKSVKTWTPAQLRLFLEHAHGHRLYAAFLLGAMTGMRRRGEVLGLRWTDNTETGRDGTLETANFTP